MKKEALSIKDIARSANVSHSTVSRALRSSPLVNVETAERIRRIASDANFRVSGIGRSLATGRTHMIGLMVTNIADPFFAETVSTVEYTAATRGYSVILANCKPEADREMKVLYTLEEHRVDGVLVMTSDTEVSRFADKKVPMVLLNTPNASDTAYSIGIDNAAAAESAVRFLIQLGHRRIAYIGSRAGMQIDVARERGYRHALEGSGLTYNPQLVVRGDSQPEAGMSAMDELISLPDRPTAVFCYNDMTALGALSAARVRGLRVPQDLSIVGFDDLLISSYINPPLTTVRQPKQHMGQIATEMLLNLINGSKSERSRKLKGELILRESTGPAPSSVR